MQKITHQIAAELGVQANQVQCAVDLLAINTAMAGAFAKLQRK